ncbi:MAG TPA: Crp/Fnr family transcriptional regulator [Candidatus Acidoferrum sp.]
MGPSSNGSGTQKVQNTILLSLPTDEFDALFAKLTFIELPKHALLNEIGQPIEWAYFVNSGLASFLNVMADGKSVEVGLAGKEGFVGLPLLAGFRTSPSRAVMQVDGSAFRISAVEMQDALKTSLILDRCLQRFSQVLGMQATQVAACNRLHEVHRRLARWLLMSQDRLAGDVVPLTQETLANMLGTRRASVTEAAGVLQRAGLITYRRGDVKIDNRRGLEAASCECYVAMKRLAEKWQSEGNSQH